MHQSGISARTHLKNFSGEGAMPRNPPWKFVAYIHLGQSPPNNKS